MEDKIGDPMTQQTLRESLQKALIEHEQGIIHSFASASANIDTMVARKKATDEIMSAIKRAIPKERPMTGDKLECLCDSAVGGSFCSCDFSENEGYNQAIDDFTKAVE